MVRTCLAALVLLPLAGWPVGALGAELVRLTPENWERYAPDGKEADCTYGDFVLTNDGIVAVVGNPVPGRHANLTVTDVGGALIDLTSCHAENDQLSAFYPGNQQHAWELGGVVVNGQEVAFPEEENYVADYAVTLRFVARPAEGQPHVELRYTVQDDRYDVLVETIYTNSGELPVEVEPADALRADRTFTKAANGTGRLFWVYDEWFDQAYGVYGDDGDVQFTSEGDRLSVLRYVTDGATKITLQPGQGRTLTRRVVAGDDLTEVKFYAALPYHADFDFVAFEVRDTAGQPVTDATISLAPAGSEERYGWGRTGADDRLGFDLPRGKYRATVAALGRDEVALDIDTQAAERYTATMNRPGWVVASIADEQGGPIPCKTAFLGKGGTPDPFFGPDSGEHAVHNLYYSHNGQFRQVLPPGRYDVIVSHGPEYDAVFTTIEVRRGEETKLEARLVRSVQTPGWVSADFHSHASPSGDNTTSQYGRVLNLLAEHLEFAPCTEHNRVSSYAAHLARLQAAHLMATCSGIELTGSPLPLNHQNAFPLEERPRTQDGGGPQTDPEPEVQISRLALWDGGSDKLVQQNHPDLGWMFFDRDADGQPDRGYEKLAGFMDVVEVHPPHLIFQPAIYVSGGKRYNNTIFNWLQLLNQGHRIPGVVNTDAHYNFHGSGFLRDYLASPTDDPAAIGVLDMVHAAEQGHVVMTNAPFLEVRLQADQADEGPSKGTAGDDVLALGGRATLDIRVECANWYDVDRVQVFLNGRPVEALNFTRADARESFSTAVVRFQRSVPLALERDTHVIVAAAGERSTLGPVMGPQHGQDMPIAVSNPIWVDVDGGGFAANGDTLGAPLPVRGGVPAQ